MPIRLDDLLASFRQDLRGAAKAPRTIELYSQSVRYFSRWLSDRGREPVLDELTRHAVAGRAGRDGRALHRRHPAAGDAAVLPVAGH